MASIPSALGTNRKGTRTGAEDNEPSEGFSEGTEIFEIYHDTGERNTTFAPGEDVNIRLTSNDVNWSAIGPGRVNNIILADYDGNLIFSLNDANAFTQQAGGPPYVYTASFQAPSEEDHYLLEVYIRDSMPEGRDRIQTSDVIKVGNGTVPPKHIMTYSEPACINPDWSFGNSETLYLKVHTSNPIETSNSEIIFADYFGNEARENIDNLHTPTVTVSGNDSIITIDLLNDLNYNQLINGDITGNYCYTIAVELEDTNGDPMAVSWAAQIQILPPPSIIQTYATPQTIFASGTDTTMIITEFSDEDAPGINDFRVTFRVRDPTNAVITLVDDQPDGQGGLTITSLGNNRYNASYVWNPPDAAELGAYDLYARVNDSQNGVDEDGFNNNLGELTLIGQGEVPVIEVGNTTCTPSRINIIPTEIVTFIINFSDTNDPQLTVDDFSITLKIRDVDNNEILLAGNKRHGEQGDMIGAGDITITNYQTNLFQVTLTWDPADTEAVGFYDLFFSVTTIYGSAIDDYPNNENELELYSTGYPPEITVGDTACLPSSIDIIGTPKTMIYCEFTDPDNPAPTAFNVTFKVRPPSNNMNDVITLVDDKATGGTGEFGNTVTIEQSANTYFASYDWDPPEDMDIGLYDLYFFVRDEYNNSAEDSFSHNRDELELITSVTPPTINAGDTKCVPSSVNKVGTGTTKIYCEFSDETFISINDFNVTFKIRDPNNDEYILVDDKAHDGSGEDPNQSGKVEITYSGTVFTAWYEWDPPLTFMIGKYDLYFGVKNKDGGYAKDNFDNNQDELTIETSGNAPVITKTDCIPSTVSVDGANTVKIYSEFTDADNPEIANFSVTIKVRDPDGVELVLVNDKAHGGAAEVGGTVTIIKSGSGYLASYDWDPQDTQKLGKYDLYFRVIDETLSDAISGFNNNQEKLELTTGTPQPTTPKLTSGGSSHEGNTYIFKITYSDADNDPPNADGVILILGNDTYKMKESDVNDTDYSDGKDYYYSLELDDGEYKYQFKVINRDNDLFETDEFPLVVGPGAKESDEEDNTLLLLAIVVVVIIIILLLVLFLIKKKSSQAAPRMPMEPGKPSEGGVRIAQPMEEEPEQPPEAEEPSAEEPSEPEQPAEAEEPSAEESSEPEQPAEAEEPPTEEPPTEEPPVAEEPPTEEPPAPEAPPVEEPPAPKQPPGEQPPAPKAKPVQEPQRPEQPAKPEQKTVEEKKPK